MKRLAELDKIEADINGVQKGARDIVSLAQALGTATASLNRTALPSMPAGLAGQVQGAITEASRTTEKLLRRVEDELRLVEKRMQAFVKALVEDQKSNMDKARGWFTKFVDKHDRTFDRAFRDSMSILPGGAGAALMLDGGSVTKGFGTAALGTIDLTQLAVRHHYLGANDRSAQIQIDNMAESARRDPVAMLKGMISYDKLKILLNPKTSMQDRREAGGELAGGLAFDALIGALTGGLGAGATRGVQSVNAGRRGLADIAGVNLAKMEANSALSARSARLATENMAKANARSDAVSADYGVGALLGDVVRRALGRRTKLADVQEAARRASEARRAEAKAAQAARIDAERLAARKAEFDAAVSKLRHTHVDLSGIRAAAASINSLAAHLGLSVPTNVRDVITRLLEAARDRHIAAQDNPPKRVQKLADKPLRGVRP
jgi:hypothetical protein